jgi:glycerol-3-phosphate dehydrogenase
VTVEANGVVRVGGGKYTTYRVMARDAVDLAARDLGLTNASTTDQLPLLGATRAKPDDDRIRQRHGSCADEVLMLAQTDPRLAAPLSGAGHYICAEAVHAVTHQGALDLDDIVSRRTRVSIETADRGRAAAAAIAPLVAPALGWSEARTVEELGRYIRLRDAEAAAENAPNDAEALAAYRAVVEGQTRAPGSVPF